MYINTYKKRKKALRNTIITAVFNIILNFLFIPYFSYNGTSLSTVLSQILVMFLNGWSARDFVKNIILSKKFIRNLKSSCIGCIGIILICLLCKFSFYLLWVRAIVSISLSILIYILILIVCKNEIVS